MVPVITETVWQSTDTVIDDIVQRTRVSKLPQSVRGTRPADIAALTVIGPEFREFDARIRVEPSLSLSAE